MYAHSATFKIHMKHVYHLSVLDWVNEENHSEFMNSKTEVLKLFLHVALSS